MDDVRLRRYVRWSVVAREEGLPRRRVRYARIEVVEYAPREERRLLERRVTDAWSGKESMVEERRETSSSGWDEPRIGSRVHQLVWATAAGTGGLTSEGCDRAEHAAIHHAVRLARVITPDTCDFRRVSAIVQYVEHLVTRGTPVRIGRHEH